MRFSARQERRQRTPDTHLTQTFRFFHFMCPPMKVTFVCPFDRPRGAGARLSTLPGSVAVPAQLLLPLSSGFPVARRVCSIMGDRRPLSLSEFLVSPQDLLRASASRRASLRAPNRSSLGNCTADRLQSGRPSGPATPRSVVHRNQRRYGSASRSTEACPEDRHASGSQPGSRRLGLAERARVWNDSGQSGRAPCCRPSSR